MRIPRFLRNFGNAVKKIPLEESDHWIKLPVGCTPLFTITFGALDDVSRELHRTARFWSVLLATDHDLAETSRKNACSSGGRLPDAILNVHSLFYCKHNTWTGRWLHRTRPAPVRLVCPILNI
jgi:hypothetical protein